MSHGFSLRQEFEKLICVQNDRLPNFFIGDLLDDFVGRDFKNDLSLFYNTRIGIYNDLVDGAGKGA